MEVIKNAKFQLNNSKIMSARPNNTGTSGVNTGSSYIHVDARCTWGHPLASHV